MTEDVTARELVDKLVARGVRLSTNGVDLDVEAEPGVLTAEWTGLLKRHKKELVRVLDGGTYRLIVPFQPFGSQPPLFCVHGFAGSAFFYRHVTRHLGEDQPAYGVQSRALDGYAVTEKSIEEIAGKYLEEVCRVEPNGPYMFVAHCAGGFIAFEMAQQLVARGKEVILLAMMDVVPPATRLQFSNHNRFKTRMKRVRDESGLGAATRWLPGALVYGVYRRLVPRQKSRFHFLVGWLCGVFGVQMPTWCREDYAKERFTQLIMNYQTRPYDGEVVLIRGRETQERDIQSDLGWSSIAQRGVIEEEIPVSHVEMVTEERVAPRLIAEVITRRMAAFDPDRIGRAPAPEPSL